MPANIKWNKSTEQIAKDKLGKDTATFAANELKRIISPFTPRNTGALEDTAQIIAGESILNKLSISAIHYVQQYAAKVYYNEAGITFRKDKRPLATSKWDEAAMNAGGKDKLISAVQKYINQKGS